jgi:cytochrome c oxidase subunit III
VASHSIAHADEHHALHAHQFEDVEQQRESVVVGMWAFLCTEVLFFGALFMAYFLYRWKYHEAYLIASQNLNYWWGGLNTFVLLLSSLTMALAVHAAQEGKKKPIITYTSATIVLAFVFLVVKYFEYTEKWHHNLFPTATFGTNADHPIPENVRAQAKLFFCLYFFMTGLHAFHIIIGIGALVAIVWLARRNWFTRDYYQPVEMVGIYWHFVDVVWVFLFPLLYLIDRSVQVAGGH